MYIYLTLSDFFFVKVVTLAVYSFFGTCIMGRQWIDKPSSDGTVSARYRIDLYFPIFTMLQVNLILLLIVVWKIR